MTEDEITFSAQQEQQSELECDDDDDDEEPEPMPSMNVYCGAMHQNNIEIGRIVQEFDTFQYNALQLQHSHLQWTPYTAL